ncbi:MAG: hypothetical protein K9N46_10960 [Candidatus Marinimicrobia bacterium]|nr:hypothetical protein [Candidatus Neomarinimicrobiota bacterium]MCF7827699.1 hypothetical protein [Candidatus Neomarinimicrobiota bacterium]MCF7881246.1 hypothetical protein [Candidatus Neomarinimicrobiota bacterium]
MRYLTSLLTVFLILCSVVSAADFATQLRSENRLTRSPVIEWNTYLLQAQEDSIGLPQSPLNKNFFKSALIPGWGQLSQEKYTHSGIFLGIEVAAFVGYSVYDQKYADKKDEFQAHAKDHWSVTDWLDLYNPQSDPSTHTVHIRYKPTGEEFAYPVTNNSVDYPCPPTTCPEDWEMVWDHEGYENAYKYDQFAMGWDTYDPANPDNTTDSDEINPSRYENKLLRDKANSFAETSTMFIYGVLFNHIASAFETILFPPEADEGTAFRMQMRYQPAQVQDEIISTVNLECRW